MCQSPDACVDILGRLCGEVEAQIRLALGRLWEEAGAGSVFDSFFDRQRQQSLCGSALGEAEPGKEPALRRRQQCAWRQIATDRADDRVAPSAIHLARTANVCLVTTEC